ncbi:hypothetical protein AX774_g3882 [Zancudomyces culisetae]|uniref:Uncharacterized protein n=1 Tax=Zancudomyces culisetae TaxID=1213189 RepID=A0A1R1PP05_ZANCU|nr:hypothetical protein AX774_g3882 [Zancudomyces culisetae]|eukprot:OMH82633.1 hypothetical protein AX774_g3882 [Zancudomyces culisetae]
MACKKCRGWDGICCMTLGHCSCDCHTQCECVYCSTVKLVMRNPGILPPSCKHRNTPVSGNGNNTGSNAGIQSHNPNRSRKNKLHLKKKKRTKSTNKQLVRSVDLKNAYQLEETDISKKNVFLGRSRALNGSNSCTLHCSSKTRREGRLIDGWLYTSNSGELSKNINLGLFVNTSDISTKSPSITSEATDISIPRRYSDNSTSSVMLSSLENTAQHSPQLTLVYNDLNEEYETARNISIEFEEPLKENTWNKTRHQNGYADSSPYKSTAGISRTYTHPSSTTVIKSRKKLYFSDDLMNMHSTDSEVKPDKPEKKIKEKKSFSALSRIWGTLGLTIRRKGFDDKECTIDNVLDQKKAYPTTAFELFGNYAGKCEDNTKCVATN